MKIETYGCLISQKVFVPNLVQIRKKFTV